MSLRIPKQAASVTQIELVETYNIYRSLTRLRDIGSYDSTRWKRALNHAAQMANIDRSTSEKIRLALELP